MRLISWNIQQGRGVDGRVSLARIAQEILDTEADIICLQEVSRGFEIAGSTNANFDQCEELATYFPGFNYVFGAGMSLDNESHLPRKEFGNIVLSRWPIEASENHLLPWPSDPAAVKTMRRGAIDAVVSTPYGPLKVITTHLEYHSELQRLKQIDHLLNLVEVSYQNWRDKLGCSEVGPYLLPKMPAEALICGDFNILPDGVEYLKLTQATNNAKSQLIDLWRTINLAKSHPATCGVYDSQQWPEGPHTRDYLFTTTGLSTSVTAYKVDLKTASSDHQPTVVEFDETILSRALMSPT